MTDDQAFTKLEELFASFTPTQLNVLVAVLSVEQIRAAEDLSDHIAKRGVAD